MARLIVLAGPPGLGKSTLAKRYVADHPLVLCLDIDAIHRLIGGSAEPTAESGLLASRLTVEMARVHLHGGHDVVVPQFLVRGDVTKQLRDVAISTGADFVAIVLMDSSDNAIMDDRLLARVIASRPQAFVIPTTDGDADRAYQDLLAVLKPATVYDRQLLLFSRKRVSMLDLWEVQRYGADSYGDADHVSIYGMPPVEWYARGIRLLGRTAVECTSDALADAVARDVTALSGSFPWTSRTLVIDPFAGSGNTLYWLVRRLAGSRGLGFELDENVCTLTKRNLAIVESPIEVENVDYVGGLAGVTAAGEGLIVVFVAPPWGDALDPVSGLDLRRTKPAVAEIVDVLLKSFPHNPLLIAVQVFETVEPHSLAEVQSRFDWSALHLYTLNEAGQNHGVLLGTRGWAPR